MKPTKYDLQKQIRNLLIAGLALFLMFWWTLMTALYLIMDILLSILEFI